MKKIFSSFFALGIICSCAHASENEMVLSSYSEDRFVDVIQCFYENATFTEIEGVPQTLTLEVAVNSNHILVKSAKQQSVQRNYNQPVLPNEKADLAHITTTLARNSLPSLATSKSSLKKVGDRIDHLHPLRFLMTIFTDEELKANVSAIRSRGWVWDKFYSGLEGSLKEESRKNNMNNEFVVDFANTIGINAALVQPLIQEKKWKEFVNLLIDTVPRTGNPTRYDM